jgi:hypothetical protein
VGRRAVELVAALSFINITLVAGPAALRFGVKLHD